MIEITKDRFETSRALFLNIDEVLELRVFGVGDSQGAQMLLYSLIKAIYLKLKKDPQHDELTGTTGGEFRVYRASIRLL